MPHSRNHEDGFCSRLFRFIYRQQPQEQLVLAVQKLVDTVMLEAMLHDYPLRFISRLANPYGAPNNTPEEYSMQNFLLHRDFMLYDERHLLPEGEHQEFVHEHMMKTNIFSKTKKYAKIWMNKANVFRKFKMPERSMADEIGLYQKHGIVAAAQDFFRRSFARKQESLRPELPKLLSSPDPAQTNTSQSTQQVTLMPDSVLDYYSTKSPSDVSFPQTEYLSTISLKTLQSKYTDAIDEDNDENEPTNSPSLTVSKESNQKSKSEEDSPSKDDSSRQP